MRAVFLLLLCPLVAKAQHTWQKPVVRELSEVERIIGQVKQTKPSRDLRIIWVWDFDKNHAPGFHEYVKARDLCSGLLKRVPRVTVESAHQFPSAKQWEAADLVVFYLQMQAMKPSQFASMDAFLQRGGGLVAIHGAFIQGPIGVEVAKRFGLAWKPGKTRWGVLPIPSSVAASRPHGIFNGFSDKLTLGDEHYWGLDGKTNELTVLATSQAGPPKGSKGPPKANQLDGKQWPLFWTKEIGKGRVFGSIPGHNLFTFNDPFYRTILFRGMAWAMRESFDPFKPLVTHNALIESAEATESRTDGPTAGDWASYNQSPEGWRFNAHEKTLSPKNAAQLELKWQFPPKNSKKKLGMICATPSVVNGHVYFGTATLPRFYKLKPNGEVAWVFEIGDEDRRRANYEKESQGLIPRGGVYSSALVTDSSVFFADTPGVAYCLDRKTGVERWRVNTRADGFPGSHHANVMMASPILVEDKVVFAGGGLEHRLPRDPGYKCCYGRGFVMALNPKNGRIIWKYDVGPIPIKYDPPFKLETPIGVRTFHYGPSTSSVWCTPSYDSKTQTVFFGTDTHNSPRRPTKEDPLLYTPHSSAIIAVDSRNGHEKWITQINKHDVWNHTMPGWNPKTGYKDQSIGDTPKIVTIQLDGKETRVIGAGCKNGGFYILRIDDGSILAQTPIYLGPPMDNPKIDPRTLALPSTIGGLQTGCASDGKSFFTNGIDCIFKVRHPMRRLAPPSGGRVTSISADTKTENWRHERPKVPWVGGTKEKPLFRNTGDPVASGVAIANGLAFFTTLSSNKLVALNASTGELLKEIQLGPVLAGPSVSRGRVYIGTGNTHFTNLPAEAYFPKRPTGFLYSFGLPDEDEVDRMGAGDE
jgi:outer membrane protein assembly factor BamB